MFSPDMFSPEEFEKDRTIDPSQLDVEAAVQADLFFKWAERAAGARAKEERLKLRLSTLEARLQIRCRDKPENFGLGRVTDAGIIAAVKCNKKYLELYESYLRARHTSAILDRAVEAMEQRKRMLEVLITLHGQEYFAGPSVPRDLYSAWKERSKKIEQSVNDKQTKVTRKRGSV